MWPIPAGNGIYWTAINQSWAKAEKANGFKQINSQTQFCFNYAALLFGLCAAT